MTVDRNIPKSSNRDLLRELEVSVTTDRDLIDQYFDRDADALELDELVQRVAKSPETWREIAETQHLVDSLSEPVAAPDLSGWIMARLEADPESPLHRAARNRRWIGIRSAIAASLLGAIMLGVWAKTWPVVTQPVSVGPVSAVDAGPAEPDWGRLRSLMGGFPNVFDLITESDAWVLDEQRTPTNDNRIIPEDPRYRMMSEPHWGIPGMQQIPVRQADDEPIPEEHGVSVEVIVRRPHSMI
jgi:hypothetical protein